MLIKYTPAELEIKNKDAGQQDQMAAQDLSSLFSGFIEIKVPSYPERLRFPKEIGLTTSGETESTINKTLNELELLAKTSEKIQPFINSVNLVYLPDGQMIESIEDLYAFPDAGPLITSLCTKFILGFLEKKA